MYVFIHPVRLPWVEHQYLRLVASDVVDRYKCHNNDQEHSVINSIIPNNSQIGTNSIFINCHLEVRCGHTHIHICQLVLLLLLQSTISVGDNCFLSGLGAAFSDLKVSRVLCSHII